MSATGQFRLHAVAWGLFSSAVFSVPIAIVVGLFDRDGSSGFGVVTILKLGLLLLSAAFAGYATGRTARAGYALNGAVAGAATFVLVQIAYSVARGQFSNPLALIYALFLGACLGTVGGLFASNRMGGAKGTKPDNSETGERDR